MGQYVTPCATCGGTGPHADSDHVYRLPGEPPTPEVPHLERKRPFSEMRERGLLWLINREVFHPRGYALAFHVANDGQTVSGWSMLGDGTEVWEYADSEDEDALFRAAEDFLLSLRPQESPGGPS